MLVCWVYLEQRSEQNGVMMRQNTKSIHWQCCNGSSFFLFFFTWWSKTKKGFFSFSQTKPFHDRSEWLDNITWRMEHQGRSTVFVEMGWFGYVIVKIISQLPVQFWSDQQHYGMWSLLFKLETAKLMCLQHVSHLAQWYVEQTGCIHTLCHYNKYKLFAMVSDFLSFLL